MKQKYIITAKTIVASINNIVKVITSVVCASPDATFEITFDEFKPTRSELQNDKMWAMLHDIQHQIDWIVDGVEIKLTDEEWKDLFTALLQKEMRVAKGINGGVVLLGRSTKKMKVQEISDVIELMYVFGAEREVVWSERSKE